VIAFARSFRGTTVLVLAGRFFAQLGADTRVPVGAGTWGDAEVVLRKQLPSGPYRDIFSGETVSPVRRDGDLVLPIAEAFSHLPIAMLVNLEGKSQGQGDGR
jgi:maltooligosyltrehalose synthase